MKPVFQLASIAITFIALSNVVLAEEIKDAVGPGDSDSRWIIGGSIGSINNIYAGEGTEEFFVPNLQYNGDKFFIQNASLNFSIGQIKNFTPFFK